MSVLRATILASTILYAGIGPLALAAPGTDEPAALEARKHYEEGTKAYNMAEFPRAIAEFKAAYNAKPDPLLLYNIAQSFRLAGDDAQALFFYKSFLRNMPDAPNRKEVDGRIKTLEKQVAEHKKATPEPAVTPPAPTTLAPPPLATAPAPIKPVPAEVKPVEIGGNTNQPPPPETPNLNAPGDVPASGPGVNLAAAPETSGTTPEGEPSKPIYKKWWFWTGVGVVALLGIAAAGNANKPPATGLGLYDPNFK